MSQLKFLVDENCAQVTKWLRFYGFDADEVRSLSDAEISKKTAHENRILITRDQELWHMHPGPAICLYSDDLQEQLRTIFQKVSIPDEADWFSRCVLCNVGLQPFAVEEVRNYSNIPPKVKESHTEFWSCPKCKRLYWEGSHFDRTRTFLQQTAQDLKMNSNIESSRLL